MQHVFIVSPVASIRHDTWQETLAYQIKSECMLQWDRSCLLLNMMIFCIIWGNESRHDVGLIWGEAAAERCVCEVLRFREPPPTHTYTNKRSWIRRLATLLYMLAIALIIASVSEILQQCHNDVCLGAYERQIPLRADSAVHSQFGLNLPLAKDAQQHWKCWMKS